MTVQLIKKENLMKNELKTTNESLQLDHNYKHFLSGIKERLQTAQIRAALAANSELIQLGVRQRLNREAKKSSMGNRLFRAILS